MPKRGWARHDMLTDATDFIRMIMSIMLALSEAERSCEGKCSCPCHHVDSGTIMRQHYGERP